MHTVLAEGNLRIDGFLEGVLRFGSCPHGQYSHRLEGQNAT
jgi:hypothetical protein